MALSLVNDGKVAKAIQQVTQIATLPEVTTKIVQVVEDPRSTAKDLQNIIKHDVALSAKILKVVNSAFYGLPRQVSSVDRAIVLLGLSTVKNIAVATSMTKLFSGQHISSKFTAKDLWQHSLACGVFCKMIAQTRRMENADELFVAGLMHDLGIVVEKQVFPQELAEIIDETQKNHSDLCQVEQEKLGADHQAFGTALAGKWKFPHLFQLTTGYHHQPFKTSEQYQEITAIAHLADVLAMKKNIGFTLENLHYEPEVLAKLGLAEEQLGELFDAFDEKFEVAEMVMK
ncbi:MAG: HDOD domain-containing protein [Phycisphaerae bacterium]